VLVGPAEQTSSPCYQTSVLPADCLHSEANCFVSLWQSLLTNQTTVVHINIILTSNSTQKTKSFYCTMSQLEITGNSQNKMRKCWYTAICESKGQHHILTLQIRDLVNLLSDITLIYITKQKKTTQTGGYSNVEMAASKCRHLENE